jgi:hypothetical protein
MALLANKFAVDGNTVTLAGGAIVALLVVAEIFFHRARGRARAERPLGLFGKLGFVALAIGWLMMWFTEEAIWSPTPRTCTALASIELKGQVYRNCSYLVHRYETGEWLFFGGLAALVICVALSTG